MSGALQLLSVMGRSHREADSGHGLSLQKKTQNPDFSHKPRAFLNTCGYQVQTPDLHCLSKFGIWDINRGNQHHGPKLPVPEALLQWENPPNNGNKSRGIECNHSKVALPFHWVLETHSTKPKGLAPCWDCILGQSAERAWTPGALLGDGLGFGNIC